jgi:hypothetical protein
MPRFARHNKNLLLYFAARGFYFFFLSVSLLSVGGFLNMLCNELMTFCG